MITKQKLQLFSYLFVSVVLCAAVAVLYANYLSRSVSAYTVDALKELSLHDLYNINGTLNQTWDELYAAGQRVRANAPQNEEALEANLSNQLESSPLAALGLLDQNGNLYTARRGILPVENTEYARQLKSGAEKTVLWYNGHFFPALPKSALLYAVKIQPFEMDGRTLIAAVGIQDISRISAKLKIDSFGGKGFSTVIDSKGNFIVNIPSQGGISQTDNFFDWFLKGKFPKDVSARALMEQMQHEGEGLFTYVNADGVEKVVSFMPVPDTDWTLIVNIPSQILKQQTQGFVYTALAMLAGLLALLVFLLAFFFRIRLSAAQEKAQAKAKEEFFSRMRHEIRTPLNGILGLNYLMKQSAHDPQRLQEYLEKSSHTAKYLLAVINDILDISQLTQDKMSVENAPFSLQNTIVALESVLRMHTEDKTMGLVVDARLPYPHVLGDEMRLEQVLLNVLDNAVKFTHKGGTVTLRARQEEPSGGKVVTRFEVEDNGCGMSDALQKHIFESFHQQPGRVSPGNAGTGLGLSISALLMKKMGGSISVQSKLGQGSRFTITLPAQLAEKDNSPSETAQTGAAAQTKRSMNILVAEDNELNAEILMDVLELEGHRVSWAGNGNQAVDLFKASEPGSFDLILMDLQMPVTNGYEAARQIRALSRPDAQSVPIWACTANTFKEDQKQAKLSGMSGFIAKPIDVKQLLKKLETEL